MIISGNVLGHWESWRTSGEYHSYTQTPGVSHEQAQVMAELGLPANAGKADIKRAYRHFLLTEHPDKGGDDAAFADKHKKWQFFFP